MRSSGFVAGLVLLAACHQGLEGPSPVVSGLSPSVVCSEQVATVVTIRGSGLSPLHEGNLVASKLTLPSLTLERVVDLEGNEARQTVEVPNGEDTPNVTWKSLEEMSFSVCPPGTCSQDSAMLVDYDLPPGLYSVGLKNPNGAAAGFASSLLAVPPPVLDRTEPDLLGVSGGQTVTLTGEWFVRIGDDLGAMKVDGKLLPITALDDCRALPAVRGETVEACRAARVEIPSGVFSEGTYEVAMVGPGTNGCQSRQTEGKVTVTFVGDPKVASIDADLICTTQGGRTMSLTGEAFLVVDGALPAVVVGDLEVPALSVDGCETLAAPQLRERVEQCTRLTFSLEEGSLPVGVHAVGVRHPPPTQGQSASTLPLMVMPPPTLTSLGTEALCTAQGERTLLIEGDGLVFFDETGGAPTVTLSDEGWPMAMVAVTPVPESCRPVERTVSDARVCTQAMVTLDKNTVGFGTYTLSVTNPEPVGCTSTTERALLIVPPPSSLAFSPATICNSADGDSSVMLNGSHFTVVGGQSPSLRIVDDQGANPVVVPTVASNCLEIGREGLPVSTNDSVLDCQTLSARIPARVLTGANVYATTVVGAEGVGCEAEPLALSTAEGPTLARIDSAKLCVGGGQLVVDGVNLTPSVTFSLVAAGGAPAFPAESATMSNCTGGRCTRATVDFGLTPAGDFGVQAALAGQCASVLTQPVKVSRGPLTFGVDPPAMHADYATSVSVYVANTGDEDISAVTFFPAGEDPDTSASAMRFTGADLDLGRAGRAVVRLPSGMAVGSWSVRVELSGGCGQSILRGALDVVKNLTPGLTLQMLPAYGYVNEDVSVTVTSTVPLDSIPILYLSNANAPSATELVGASLQSPTTLSAVVPAGRLQAGQRYDLLLVGSSEGERVVAVAPNLWTANALPAPTITHVTPESLPTGTDDVTVTGTNFNPTTTLRLECFDIEGRVVASPTFTSGPRYVSSTELFFAATFSSTQALCDVIVTNADHSTFRFSSIVVSNPAQKLGSFAQASSTLQLPRRALGATVARANVTSRFLYAIGGDAGVEATATRIVEMASIDAFGRLGQFRALPPTARGSAGRIVGPSLALNKPHTYTQAVTIGRWLWVVGGSDGTGAITDVERAFVLDPLNVVKMTDVDIALDPTTGLGGGAWLYRVSPVMGPDDPYNPGGELLASEPLTVRLPSVLEGGIAVTVRWERFESAGVPAAKYNIYRTPSQQRLGEDDVVWIGQVDGDTLEFTDRGGFPAKPFAHPLPVGATGVWQTTAPDQSGTAVVDLALSTRRSGAGVAVMRDPLVKVPGRDVHYLYAVAGNTGTETAVSLDHGTEYMVVEIDRDTQLAYVSGFKQGPQVKLGQTSHGKWQASAFAGSPDSIPYNRNRGYLYFASGLRSTAMAENIDYTHLVAPVTFGSGSTPAGLPGAWSEANSSGFGGQSSYAGVFVNGFAYCLGGLASVGILDSCYQSQNQTTTSTTTGSMSNPSSCSVSLKQKRMLSASATASGYLFVVGGTTSQAPAMGSAMTTVERAIY